MSSPDAFDIYAYVKAMLGFPVVEVEITDQQLELFLKESLQSYSRLIPVIKWYSIPAYAGVQAYEPDASTIGNGITEVMIPRLDPIAPLMLSSGPRLDIYGYRYCLTGNTSISLLDGRERTILEIIEEYGDGKFWVYSVDEDGNVKPGLAHSAHLTGVNEKVIRVTLDNGNSVTCTPEHRFMLRDGTYRPAGELKPGDSLMPLYRDYEKISKRTQLYETCYAGSEKKFTHRIAADLVNTGTCSMCGASLPDSTHGIRHHINFNHLDNRPENIQWVTHEEHGQIHDQFSKLWETHEFRDLVTERMKSNWEDPEWAKLASERAKAQWKDQAYRNEKIASIVKRHRNDPEFQKIRDAAASATMRKLWTDDDFVSKKSAQQSAMMKGKWADEEWRNTIGQVILAALEEARKDPVYEKWNRERLSAHNAVRWATDTSYRERMSREAAAHMNRLWENPEFRLRVTLSSSARLSKLWEDPEFRERHRERLIADWKDPKYRAKQTAAISEAMRRDWEDPERRAARLSAMSGNWTGDQGLLRRANVSSKAKTRWADPEYKSSVSEKMTTGRLKKKHVRDSHGGEYETCDVCKSMYDKRMTRKNKKLVPTNHKVVFVEDAGYADVYDISVEEYHNFALTAGCQVENSYPYRDISELYIDYMYFGIASKILSADFKWTFMDGKIYISPKPDESFPLTYSAAHTRSVDEIPTADVDWIKNHVLAQTEIAVGRVRRKFNVPGAQSTQMLDGDPLVKEGLRRLELAEQELLARTPDFGPMPA